MTTTRTKRLDKEVCFDTPPVHKVHKVEPSALKVHKVHDLITR